MAFTIDAAVTELNRRSVTYAKDIQSVIRQGLELEAELTPKAARGDYIAPSMSVGQTWQGFQCGFLPRNQETLTGLKTTQTKAMVHLQWDCTFIESLHKEYLEEKGWAQDNTDPINWNFPKYIYDQLVLPKMKEELNYNSFNAVYTAPTTGVSNNSSDTYNGWFKTLADHITAGKIVPIPTGALVTATILTQLATFVQAIPIQYRQGECVIRCSYAVYEMARAAYIAGNGGSAFILAAGLGMNDMVAIPLFPNVKLKPYVAMGTSQRLIFKPSTFEPQLWTYNPDEGGAYPAGLWGSNTQTGVVYFKVNQSRGYGWNFGDMTFVNERN